MTRCLHRLCEITASYNVEGSKAPAYCKKHSDNGMVNIMCRRCSHEACPKQPHFCFEGGRTAKYCKQHAETGMVNIYNRRCAHDSCTRQPNFDVGGSKMPAYCKRHSKDGMVDVRHKRCGRFSCTKYPSFNTVGSKSPAYCKKHSEDGMIDVRKKRCSYDSCMTHPSFNHEGKGTAVYCKRHAEEGMLNVNHKQRYSQASRTTEPARDASTNVVADGLVTNSDCGKGSGLEVDVEQRPHCRNLGPSKWGVEEPVGASPSKEGPRTSGSVHLGRFSNHNNFGTAANQTSPVQVQQSEAPLSQLCQSAEPIKTELELVVLL